MAERLTETEVRHVAKLSRLRLSDAEVRQFALQLSHVLEHVSKLNEVNIEGIEPMAHALDLANVLRDDQPKPGLATATALANAPAQDPPYFKVPKVLGDEGGA